MRTYEALGVVMLLTSSSIVFAGGVSRYQRLEPFREALEGELAQRFDGYDAPVSIDSIPSLFIESITGQNRDGDEVTQWVSGVDDLEFDLLGGQDPPSPPNFLSNDPRPESGYATGRITFRFGEDMDAIGFFVADGNASDTFFIELLQDDVQIAFVVSNGPRELPDSFLGVISEEPFNTAVIGATRSGDSWAIDDLFVHEHEPANCPADLNDDGMVGFDDLTRLLAAWGECAECPEDLNGDGIVGIQDIIELLSSWGPCPA